MVALLPSLRRNLVLFAFAFIAASMAFGTIMLTSPPTSEASVASAGSTISGVTICETLPTGDIVSCSIQN